jgi:hypothetical protein
MDQDEGMTKPQNAHLRLASQRSFSSVCVPFSTICPFGGLSCWVQSLAIKVQVSSTPTVSHHAFTLFAFEPVTSTNQISSAKTASKASVEMQLSADSNKNASYFNDKPSSTFQLVVASVDWTSKAISNLGYNKSHETSCVFQLVARAKRHKKLNEFAFRLIVEFMQQYQSQLQQDLVDLSLSNALSNAKLDCIRIKSKMPFTFQLIVGSKQLHQNKSCCASLLAARAKCLSHESGCVSL